MVEFDAYIDGISQDRLHLRVAFSDISIDLQLEDLSLIDQALEALKKGSIAEVTVKAGKVVLIQPTERR